MLIKKLSMIAAGSLVLALGFAQVVNARDYTQGEGDAAEINACNADAIKYCNDEVMCQH